MGKKPHLFILLFPLLFAGLVNGQELLRTVVPVDFVISTESLAEKSAVRKMLGSLALNNGMNIHQVKMDFQANVFISIQRDSLHQKTLKVKILNSHLSGDTHFRDFALDSVLRPFLLKLTLILRQGKNTGMPYQLSLPTSGALTIAELTGDSLRYNDPIEIDLIAEGVSYSRQNLRDFTRLAGMINSYYAYSKILEEMIARYNGGALIRKKDAVNVFIGWHEISRVNNYIQQYNFTDKLHLLKNDPMGFLERHARSKRMEKRAATLFHQIINENRKGILSDKKKYSALYARLSQRYLDRAHQLQPYLASGFEEVAQIFPGDEEREKLAEVSRLFDVFNRLDSASTPQSIYSHFIDLAKGAYDAKQFVVSLQLLKNAEQIDEWFDEVTASTSWLTLYNQSLDGIMTSYLKVSIIARRNDKFEMAEKYYDKALKIFNEYGTAYSKGEGNPSFLHFTEQQMVLSADLLAGGEYRKALILLNQARKTRQCKSINQDCPKIDSLSSIALHGLYEQKMIVINEWIQLKGYDSAWVLLKEAKSFVGEHEAYFDPVPTRDFLPPATILFESFYGRGEVLLQGRHPENALTYLLKAQEVERNFLPTQDTRLNIQVYNATIPAILKEIEKAGFETWANRLHQADSIYVRAKHLQREYQQEYSEELKEAFGALETRMEQRKCLDLSYRVNNLNTLIVNRVKSGKYDEAAEFLKEATGIIHNSPSCKIESGETIKLEEKYGKLFIYLQGLKEVETIAREGKNDTAVARFVTLSHDYARQQLERFGITKPSLYEFVSGIDQPELTRATVRYFIRVEDYIVALLYLDLLRKQGVPSGKTRKLQQIVGRGIGPLSVTEEQLVSDAQDNLWFIYFKLAHLSAKIRN